jgi:hypothetical protein
MKAYEKYRARFVIHTEVLYVFAVTELIDLLLEYLRVSVQL